MRPGHSTTRSFAGAVPAALGNLSPLRNSLRSWLATIAVDPVREQDILLATGEAVTNAIEHASDCDPHRTVAVEAFVRQGIGDRQRFRSLVRGLVGQCP